MYNYLKVKSLLKINLSATQMIQILKVSSIGKKSLKIIGPRCGKDEEGYHIEDYSEQGSYSWDQSMKKGSMKDLKVVLHWENGGW